MPRHARLSDFFNIYSKLFEVNSNSTSHFDGALFRLPVPSCIEHILLCFRGFALHEKRHSQSVGSFPLQKLSACFWWFAVPRWQSIVLNMKLREHSRSASRQRRKRPSSQSLRVWRAGNTGRSPVRAHRVCRLLSNSSLAAGCCEEVS
jgi:hypothetical protein